MSTEKDGRRVCIRGYRGLAHGTEADPSGDAGSIWHINGIGHLRVDTVNAHNIYVPIDTFLRFVEGYARFGDAVFQEWKVGNDERSRCDRETRFDGEESRKEHRSG